MFKKFLSLLRNQVVLLLLSLVVLLLIVYLAWPLFSPATGPRKMTLLLLGLGGLVLIVVSVIPQALEASRRRRASLGSIGQELNRALELLAEECPGRGGVYKVERALRLPWVLLLGSPGSGKSAALGHASFARAFNDPATRAPLCTFWLAQDVIFVHPRARLRADEQLWKDFLGWLGQRHRIDAVLLHVSATDLVGRRSDELEMLAGSLQRSLWGVSQQLGLDLPMQLMVGQCDRLDGFVRFFAELPDSERVATWGIGLAGARDYQLLSPLLAQGASGLLAALLARVGDPFRRARTPEEQAAVLAFPQETQRLGEAVARFVDALFPRGLGEGRPRLQEVCFTSTLQEGQVIPGGRHELTTDGQVIRLAPTASAPLTNLGAFFLRQPLLRLQTRATLANRPRLHWHIVALVVAAVACTGVSSMLGRRYAHHTSFLETTQKAIGELQPLSPLSRFSDEGVIKNELDHLRALGQRLCYAASADAEPICVSEELTRAAHQQAVEYLGCRIGYELVGPIMSYDSSLQRPTEQYRYLDKLAAWHKGNSPTELLLGFNALKATTLLQKRKDSTRGCPTISAQDRSWLVEYLASLWGEQPRSDEYEAYLKGNLGLFAKLYLPTEQPSSHLVFDKGRPDAAREILPAFRVKFDQDRVDKARANLRRVFSSSEGEGSTALQFYLSASELQLFGKVEVQPSGSLKETSIAKVYTAAGCYKFFTLNDKWDRWISCVRGEDSPQVPPSSLRDSLFGYYLAAHRKAWTEWLGGIKQASQIKADDPTAAAITLSAVDAELKKALTNFGRGPARKAQDKEREAATCTDAQQALRLLPAGEATDSDTDRASQLPSYDPYKEALGKTGLAVKALVDWPPNSLKPEQDAMRALDELGRRRGAFISDLNTALTRPSSNSAAGDASGTFSVPPADGLNRVLAGFEEELYSVVAARLRRYLRDGWEGLYGEWKGLRPKSAEDANNPDQAAAMRTFLKDKLMPFLNDNVVPLYSADLGSCAVKPPLGDGKRPVLCAESCRLFSQARLLAAQNAPAPAAPAAPAPALIEYQDPRLDIPECPDPPQEVWLNMKDLALLYRCDASTRLCKRSGVSSGPTSITARYAATRSTEVIASDEQGFVHLAAANKGPSAYKYGTQVMTLFRGRGSCQIRLYLDPRMLAPKQGPRAAASPLLTLKLPEPERLVCQ